MTTKRKPVPASGDPLPDVIDAANATPPATDTTTNEGDAGGEQTANDGATDQASDNADQGSGTADQADQADQAIDATSTSEIPAEQSAPAAEPQKPAEPEIVDARVLIAFDEHEVDDIVSAPAAAIEQMTLAGRVDPHPDAIAFARELHA
jgi:hypothetical protein